MGRIRVLESGGLDLSSVEELSREELSQWIKARLTSQDFDIPTNSRQDETSHSLIVDIYPRLKRSVREDIQYILLGFLAEFTAGQSSVWQGDAADELLMLALRVHVDDAIDLILEAVESQRFYPENPETTPKDADLHYRLLQALLVFGYHGSPQFWEGQARLSPDRFGAVCFDGLAQTSPERAMELLPTLPWSDEVERQILFCLPGLIEDHGLDPIGRLFLKVRQRLCPRAQSAIGSFLREEGWTYLVHLDDFVLFQEHLRYLWNMRGSREEEFAELVVLIESVTKYAEPEHFTIEQIDTLRGAVTRLGGQSISREDLADWRRSLRRFGLDIYRPLYNIPKIRFTVAEVENSSDADESALS